VGRIRIDGDDTGASALGASQGGTLAARQTGHYRRPLPYHIDDPLRRADEPQSYPGADGMFFP
jgi:hypothetical protein